MSSVSRMLAYIESCGIKKSEFYSKTGFSNGYLDKVKELGADKIEIIISKFPEVNLYWLITGKGEMVYKTEQSGIVSEPPASYNVRNIRKLKTDKKKEIQLIPLYEISASAGVMELLSDVHRQRQIPIDYIQIPNMPACDGALPISGDSMYPLLKSGDIVLFKEVNDKANIIWGEMYLAAVRHNGDEFFFSKYIQKSERNGYARFVSENKHHQPVEFPIDSIVGIALIKASIRFQSSF